MLWALALAVSQTSAQGYIVCPLPDAPAIGGSSSQFDPSWNTNLENGQKTIPIVFHLIGTSSSLLDVHVQTALDQLNTDFNSSNLDWDIEFKLAGIGPRGECTTGITRYPGIMSQNPSVVKAATRWDNTKYLNVWVLPLIEGDPLKWGVVSAQPSKFQVVGGVIQRTDVIAGTNATFDDTDGVVIKEELIYPNPAQIHTLAHEVGHWLNLLHTFAPCDSGTGSSVWHCCHPESEGATNGDFIPDTPPQHNDFGQSNCALIDHYCFNDGVPEDLSSYMGYAFSCQNKFTQGQREWMFHCLENFRPFIWSDENLRCTGVGAQSNLEITQPTNWDFTTVPSGYVTIKSELRIKNGGILNIAPGITVQFCDAAKAIVEPGGNVQLFGTLTSACHGRMWQGVEVQGTPTSNQFGGLQGRFKAHPNSIVSNAVTGIKAGGAGFGHGGGIVQCTLATLRNNQRAVQFNPYENHLPIPSMPVASNASYFIQCEFITSTDYPGYDPGLYSSNEQVPFSAFADLVGIRGIRFLGCNFVNEISSLPLSIQYGIGILAKESSFNVGDYCTGISLPCPSANQDHCLFKNLYKGIWATKTDIDPGLPHRYSVTNAKFDECWTGIQSSQGSRCYIVGNTFELGDIHTDAQFSAGNLTGLFMDFTHTNITVQENLFKLDDNAPADIHDFRIVLGTDIFFIGQANNVIRRNTYKNLGTGNQAYGEGAEPLQTTGLHYLCNDNENNVSYDFNALNTFLPQAPPPGLRLVQGLPDPTFGTPISAGNTFSHINGFESDFSYNAAAGIRYFFPNGVIPETPLTFTLPPKIVLQNNTPANNCESILCDRPPCKSEEQLAAEKQAIAPAKAQYNSLRSLYLSNPTGPDAQAQMLSMTALQEVVQGNTFDILTDIVANENGGLSDYRYWLGNMDAYETDLELVRSYTGTAELSAAVAKLNQIQSKYQLSGDLLAEFNQYQALLNIVRQHYQAGGDKYNFSNATLSTFQGYAENSPHARVRGLAKQILTIYGIIYPPEPSEGFGGGAGERQAGQSTLPLKGIQLVPNPANQVVVMRVEKNLVKAAPAYNAHVVVVSPIGATVIERDFSTLSENYDLDISGLRAGLYYVWVRFDSGESFVRPLSVIR